MSRIVDTQLGTFREVTDGAKKWFLFECPHCKDWLPLTESHMNGTEPPVHENVSLPGTRCTYGEKQEFGATLVAAIQANLLIHGKPCRDEGERPLRGPAP